MSHLRSRHQIRLSGLRVADSRGRWSDVPWGRLCGSALTPRSDGATCALHPDLPAKLRGLWPIGSDTIDRLRVRSIARALRDGTYDRFWLAGPRECPQTFALVSALLVWTIVGGAWFFLMRTRTEMSSEAAVEFDELLAKLGPVLLGMSVLGGVVFPAVIVALAALRTRRATVLAMRTSAAGIEAHFDDGRIVHYPWTECALDAKSPASDRVRPWLPFPMRQRFRNVPDLVLLRRAAERVFDQPQPRRSPRLRIRDLLVAMGVSLAVLPTLSIAAVALGQMLPSDDLPRGREPASVLKSLGIVAIIIAALGPLVPIGLAAEFGLRRMWRFVRR